MILSRFGYTQITISGFQPLIVTLGSPCLLGNSDITNQEMLYPTGDRFIPDHRFLTFNLLNDPIIEKVFLFQYITDAMAIAELKRSTFFSNSLLVFFGAQPLKEQIIEHLLPLYKEHKKIISVFPKTLAGTLAEIRIAEQLTGFKMKLFTDGQYLLIYSSKGSAKIPVANISLSKIQKAISKNFRIRTLKPPTKNNFFTELTHQ